MRASIVLMLLWPLALTAQEAKRSHDITVDDYFTQADLFQIALAPDGQHVAYTEGRWQEATDDRKTDLWVVHCRTKNVQRLTFDRPSARFPQWSADGKGIYFLANRKREGDKLAPYNGKTQVWHIGLAGGEPIPITRAGDGVDAFQIAHNGTSLYYLVHTEHIAGDWADLRGKFRQIEYGHGIEKLGQIWKLDLSSFRTEKIVDDQRNIREFTVSNDDRRIAMITTPDDKVVSFEGKSRVDVFQADTRKIITVPDRAFRAQAPSPYAWLEGLAWAPSGGLLAFNAIFDGYPAEVMIVDLNRDVPNKDVPSVARLPRPEGVSIRGYGSPLQWRRDDTLCFLGEEKARVRLLFASGFRKDKIDFTTATPGDVVVESLAAGASDSIALALATARALPDIYLWEKNSLQRLTRVNPQASSWKIPQVSIVSWKGAGGQTVEGVLELPPGYRAGDKVPLVVEIHGGPTTATYYKLQYWIYGRTLLPAKGYAVLCPNYRGSTGYGDKFLTDLIGQENHLDVEDILTGVDHLVAQGIADPDRLAVSGWSNGGYLTNCLITRTTRFKAAISGAGIVDAAMEWGANDEPAYTMVFKQGFPWSSPERYHKASATYRLDRIRTPTLIHVGANDERCPPGHSRMLYRALKEYLNVPTELLVYPGEAHGIMKYRNRKAKMEWDLAWLERHLLQKKK